MAESRMQLEEWLDDLCVRFIMNLPEEDLSSVARICFQVEEAQWFYEDFIRPLDPNLPSMSLRTFCLRIFQHCPLLAQFSVENHTQAFEQFLEYKTRVPVRGAILLNHDMDSAVLVKGWKKGASWGFPGGKINKDEDDLDCAIREVYEETSLDVRAAGLVPRDGNPKYIELPIRNHEVRLYVFRDVPMDTVFQPRTRKEISKIQWYKLSELPTFRKKAGQVDADPAAAASTNKFYMVAPFMVPLKKWVSSQKKFEKKAAEAKSGYLYPQPPVEELPTEEEGWTQPETYAPARMPTDPSTHVPAIETLDGATQELQRLLKVQPPTQGIQHPQLQQDKGSALLSILQAKSSGAAPMSSHTSQMPQTPADHSYAPAPQPRNPHHHTKQHGRYAEMQQPPPSFQMTQQSVASSGAPHQHDQRQHYPYSPESFGPSQGNNQATLVHPQPLPPQVQRSMFNNSVFQDGRSTSQPQTQSPGQNQSSWHHGQGQYPHAAQALAPPQQARPAQLSGQSMALLNAFKRDDAAPASSMPNIPGAARPTVEIEQHETHHMSYAGNDVASHHEYATTVQQQSPTELAGSGVDPRADQHRSALLGMFKKGDSDAAASPNTQPALMGQPPHLQRRSSGAQFENSQPYQAQAQVRQHAAQMQPSTQPEHLMKSLSSQHSRPMPNPPTTQDAQHIRILQRGQEIPHTQHGVEGLRTPSKTSPYTSQAQTANYPPNLPTAASMPAPTMVTNRKPEASHEQKRQLLSLFSKQQTAPAPISMSQGLQNEPMSRRPSQFRNPAQMVRANSGTAYDGSSSPRRHQESPISPAEQTFLFDYLQSVTNNASR